MILKISIADARFPLGNGVGSDAIHRDPVYSYAVVKLHDDSGITGCGFAFTLGEGNDLVCKAASFYAKQLKGKDIEELMADFGQVFYKFSNEQQFRWLGPHKGVVHLALAAVTNACYDLWAKKRSVPLWQLLISLSPEQIVNTLDLSYLEDELTKIEAVKILEDNRPGIEERSVILTNGYPGYDTSIGWFNYSDEKVKENVHKALAEGFYRNKVKGGFQRCRPGCTPYNHGKGNGG